MRDGNVQIERTPQPRNKHDQIHAGMHLLYVIEELWAPLLGLDNATHLFQRPSEYSNYVIVPRDEISFTPATQGMVTARIKRLATSGTVLFAE
jgi:hypothetical protein